MMNFEALALAEAALDAVPFGDLSEADLAFISKMNPGIDLVEIIDCYEYSAADFDGRRFIVGVDGDCYIIEGSVAFYLPVESPVGPDSFEIASATI